MIHRITSLSILFLLFLNSLSSQQEPQVRSITVTGSAEIIVPPDEIDLKITISEYGKENLGEIEKDVMKILKKNNIDTKQLNFSNHQFYWYYWWNHRRNNYKQKTFTLKLDKNTDFLALVKDLDIKGVQRLNIDKTTSDRIQELRKEVKIEAIKAAKDKASYLLESVDEELGKIISIEELPVNNNYYWRGSQSMVSNVVINNDSDNSGMDNIPKIKLRYEIKTVFAIAD